MDRKKKLLYNTATSLLYQVVGIICGFILPRMFLSFYGSAVNGVVSSISQFLGFISLCECGVGAVVQSALYKPLAENDSAAYSRIFASSERFFRKIAWILVGYTAVLMVLFPYLTSDHFDYFYTCILVFVISISSFAQYYFGMTYRLFLSADQLGFIQMGTQTVILLLNTGLSILLMYLGASVQVVKLVSSLIFLVQPIVFSCVAKKRYRIDRKIELHGEPIRQKWNGLAQHIAAVVLGNTDTVVLTLFTTLETVSVYSVYFLVVNGVKQIVVSLTTGFQAMLGNMLAKGEKETLDRSFSGFEWGLHTVVTMAFTATGFLIVPFVQVYTYGIEDTDYAVPLFAVLMTIAQAAYCLRLPYNTMVLAAGHYRQTQASAIIEAAINIVLSVVLVIRFGLVGVAIGTLAAMAYRTVYLVFYLRRFILRRSVYCFVKHVIVNVLSVALVLLVTTVGSSFFALTAITYPAWIVLAVKVGIVTVLSVLIVNLVAYRSETLAGIRSVLRRLRRR